MKKLIRKYKSVIAYLLFGVCTMIVNLLVYYLCSWMINFSTGISTVVAWFFSVVFAFVANKIWVFESRSWDGRIIRQELMAFFLCRITTGVMDLVIMLVTVDMLKCNSVVMKVLSNVLVILLNYVSSKLVIFRE